MGIGLPISACLSKPGGSLRGTKATTASPRMRGHVLGQPAGPRWAATPAQRRKLREARRERRGYSSPRLRGGAVQHSGSVGSAARTLSVPDRRALWAALGGEDR